MVDSAKVRKIPPRPARLPQVHMKTHQSVVPKNSEPAPEEINSPLVRDLKNGFATFRKSIPNIHLWVLLAIMTTLLIVKIARVAYGDVATIREMLTSDSIGNLIAPVSLVALQSSLLVGVVFCGTIGRTISKHWSINASKIIVFIVFYGLVTVISSVVLTARSFWLMEFFTLALCLFSWNLPPVERTYESKGLVIREVSPYSPLVRHKKWTLRWIVQISLLFVFPLIALGSITLLTLLNTNFWGNPQLLKIGDEEVVGYLISSNDVSSSIMRDHDRSLIIIKNDQITSVKICRIYDTDERSIYGYLDGAHTSSDSYPWCYGEAKPAFPTRIF